MRQEVANKATITIRPGRIFRTLTLESQSHLIRWQNEVKARPSGWVIDGEYSPPDPCLFDFR